MRDRYPGRFCLYYMRKGTHHMEDIKCSNKGLRFRNEYFDHPVRRRLVCSMFLASVSNLHCDLSTARSY